MLTDQIIAPHRPLRILVVGEVCADVSSYLRKAGRPNPEDPSVPLYTVDNVKCSRGMAANVVNALEALDFAEIKKELSNAGSKVRYYDENNKYIYRIDSDSPAEPIESKELPVADIYVISDYNKGAITSSFIKEITAKSKLVYIDTKKTNLADYSANNVIFKINELEYDRMDHSAIFNSCELIVTRGAHGSEWLKFNEVGIFNNLYATGYPVKTVDVCSAGDMYLAGLIYGMHITGGQRKKAMKIANAYAALSVQHLGTYIPTKEELCNFLKERIVKDDPITG